MSTELESRLRSAGVRINHLVQDCRDPNIPTGTILVRVLALSADLGALALECAARTLGPTLPGPPRR